MKIYIASCVENGAVYLYDVNNDKATLIEKTNLHKPMYLCKGNSKLYAVLRRPFDNEESGVVSFDICEDDKLKNMTEPISTHGVCGCHICFDGDDVYVANYLSGNVTKMPDTVVTHSGKGPNEARQEAPHTHFVYPTPDGNHIAVTDLGLDTVFFYDKSLNLQFKANVPQGHGARHLAFSQDGKLMYCANELESTISVFELNSNSAELLDTYECIDRESAINSAVAAIRIHNGYLYVSNRGDDSITSFKINGDKLELCSISKVGAHPRDFNIFDNLLLCANMEDDNVSVYEVDNGKLKELYTIEDIASPLCIV